MLRVCAFPQNLQLLHLLDLSFLLRKVWCSATRLRNVQCNASTQHQQQAKTYASPLCAVRCPREKSQAWAALFIFRILLQFLSSARTVLYHARVVSPHPQNSTGHMAFTHDQSGQRKLRDLQYHQNRETLDATKSNWRGSPYCRYTHLISSNRFQEMEYNNTNECIILKNSTFVTLILLYSIQSPRNTHSWQKYHINCFWNTTSCLTPIWKRLLHLLPS